MRTCCFAKLCNKPLCVFDQERKSVPEYDLVCWPARGPMPVEYFKAGDAWTVSFDPHTYNPPGEKVTVTLVLIPSLVRSLTALRPSFVIGTFTTTFL